MDEKHLPHSPTDNEEVPPISAADTADTPIESEDASPILDKTDDTSFCEEVQASEPPEPTDTVESAGKISPLFRGILEYIGLFVLCLTTVMLLFSFVFRVCSVSGPSMMPTLHDKEVLVISHLFYKPSSGDIVVFHQTSETVARFNEPIVKRIIATEGQSVRIDFTDGTVTVDGVLLEEEYIQLTDRTDNMTDIGQYTLQADHHIRMEPMADGKTHRIFEATVPEGTLFVMGDNRNNSADSRNEDIGFVDARRVLGRVLFRILPTERFGAVN